MSLIAEILKRTRFFRFTNMKNHSSQEETTTTSIAIIATVAAALALLGVVVAVTIPLQQAEARASPPPFMSWLHTIEHWKKL